MPAAATATPGSGLPTRCSGVGGEGDAVLTVHRTTTAGAIVVALLLGLTLSGATQFAWVAGVGPNRGKATVWIDGVKRTTVDLYRASATAREVVFVADLGAAATHSIQIRVLGQKNVHSSGKRVDLDAFVALTN